jgi:hypothetical protein
VSEPQSATVDVARLMEEIKERVRERRASGFYSDEEVRRITQMELEIAESTPGFHEEVEHLLGQTNDAWDVLRDPSIASHRGPGLGDAIVGAKRALWKALSPYTKLVLQRQGEFNAAILHLLNAFVLPVRDKIQDGFTRLGRKQEELALEVHERLALEHGERQRGQQALARRLDAFAGELAHVRALAERAHAAGPPLAGLPPTPTVRPGAGALPPAAYVRFEDRHRGSRAEIRSASAVTSSSSSPAAGRCWTSAAGEASSSSSVEKRGWRRAASTPTPAWSRAAGRPGSTSRRGTLSSISRASPTAPSAASSAPR